MLSSFRVTFNSATKSSCLALRHLNISNIWFKIILQWKGTMIFSISKSTRKNLTQQYLSHVSLKFLEVLKTTSIAAAAHCKLWKIKPKSYVFSVLLVCSCSCSCCSHVLHSPHLMDAYIELSAVSHLARTTAQVPSNSNTSVIIDVNLALSLLARKYLF